MVERIIFVMRLILVAKCVVKRNYSYILRDSEENDIFQHDSKNVFLETNKVRKFVEGFLVVDSKSSRRFQIRDEPLNVNPSSDRQESRTLRKFASRRIVGGKQTSIRMHPYNVAISRHGKHWCGGSLIDEQWVLSAGHCMELAHDGDREKLIPFVVRAGSSFYNKGGYQARINKVFFPGSYVPGNADYDFSLLRLDRPLPISRNIAVTDIPSREYLMVPGDMLVVTGWGSTKKSGQGDMSPRMRFVLVPVMESHKCQESYHFYISPRMMCAGYTTGGKDACNHDSGGPAIYDGVLAGVVSFGGNVCGDPQFPGVYSRVAEVSDWVNHTVHHNEASAEPELWDKIKKARIKEIENARTRKLIKEKNKEIRNWLRTVIESPLFIAKAKRKLLAAGQFF